MNRSTILALLLVGMLLCLGSCVPFGYVLYHATLVAPQHTYLLSTAGSAESVQFSASPGSLARFTLEADINSRSVQEEEDGFDKEYHTRFRFPLRYTVRDSGGNILLDEKASLAWKDGGMVSKHDADTSSSGGSVTASVNLEKFTVPVDGTVVIALEMAADTTYGADYTEARLHLYDALIDNSRYLVGAVLMFLLGFLLAMAGFVLLIMQQARSLDRAGSPHALATTEPLVRQEAMIIQLSALAGFLLPFGNLIMPVILWMVWRKKDSYLDEMGCEAVNFQLSMLIYYGISLVLCFVLIGFPLLFALLIFQLAAIVIAALHTSRGNPFRYPLSIRFFR